MISVISCSRKDPSWDLHQRNVSKTAGSPHEYIRIDNRDGRFGLCAAYNKGVSLANGEILVFMHEDVFFMEGNWGTVLEKKFSDPSVGLVGVAGTQYLFRDTPGWVVAGIPFIKGHVVHELNNGNIYHLTVFNWGKEDSDVVAVDGLFFAIRKSLFERIRFDEALFDQFHFYDLDICMQIRRTHRLIVTWDILVKHQSAVHLTKHGRNTPSVSYRSTVTNCLLHAQIKIPDLTKRIPFENFDLKGKAPQITIA